MFTVFNVMERVGSREPGKIIMLIKDGFREITAGKRREVTSKTYDIVSGVRKYPVPEMIGLKSVCVLTQGYSEELLDDEDQDVDSGHHWTNEDFHAFSDASNKISAIANAANQYCYLDDEVLSAGKWYRFQCECESITGSFAFYSGDNLSGKFKEGINVIEFRSPDADEIRIVCTGSTGEIILKDFSLSEMFIDEYKKIREIVGTLPDSYEYQTQPDLSRGENA